MTDAAESTTHDSYNVVATTGHEDSYERLHYSEVTGLELNDVGLEITTKDGSTACIPHRDLAQFQVFQVIGY